MSMCGHKVCTGHGKLEMVWNVKNKSELREVLEFYVRSLGILVGF